MLFKLSNLNSNLGLTRDYLSPALNNSAQKFKQEPMYGLSTGTKNVAVVERWLLLEVRL